jgi:hypothetical protein
MIDIFADYIGAPFLDTVEQIGRRSMTGSS